MLLGSKISRWQLVCNANLLSANTLILSFPHSMKGDTLLVIWLSELRLYKKAKSPDHCFTSLTDKPPAMARFHRLALLSLALLATLEFTPFPPGWQRHLHRRQQPSQQRHARHPRIKRQRRHRHPSIPAARPPPAWGFHAAANTETLMRTTPAWRPSSEHGEVNDDALKLAFSRRSAPRWRTAASTSPPCTSVHPCSPLWLVLSACV